MIQDGYSNQRWCDFELLVKRVSEQFYEDRFSVHGVEHWRRVEQNGLWLCDHQAADPLVVRLFAWFHDSKRENEDHDPEHGRRGAEFARSLRGELFDLDDESFEKLIYACIWHTECNHSSDITVGTCWDSDRLDLGRVGIVPAAEYMSTEFGRSAARRGGFLSQN